jgi:MinD-like ATPase involved in chromosome partitioning or flagellar assembly
MAKTTKKSKTICIASTKGGVGKTIFTLNMAGIFASLEKKVLIIDLDLTSGSIAMSLNKPYEKSIYDLVEDLKNNMYNEISEYTLKYDNNIECLPCPKDPRTASLIDIRYLSILLDRASFNYDIILIDTNHDLNATNLFTMDKVDELLFLINNDPLNLKSTRSLLAILNNMNITNYHVILNDSANPYKSYFSLFDIKNIIKANIDYNISPAFYIENIDKYIMNGKIITLESSTARVFNKDYTTMMTIATDIMKESR